MQSKASFDNSSERQELLPVLDNAVFTRVCCD
jgi:hypothetical protein